MIWIVICFGRKLQIICILRNISIIWRSFCLLYDFYKILSKIVIILVTNLFRFYLQKINFDFYFILCLQICISSICIYQVYLYYNCLIIQKNVISQGPARQSSSSPSSYNKSASIIFLDFRDAHKNGCEDTFNTPFHSNY